MPAAAGIAPDGLPCLLQPPPVLDPLHHSVNVHFVILRDALALKMVGKDGAPCPQPEWLLTSAMLRLGVCVDLAIPMPFFWLFPPFSLSTRQRRHPRLSSTTSHPQVAWPGRPRLPRREHHLVAAPINRPDASCNGRRRVAGQRPFGCAAGSSFPHGPLILGSFSRNCFKAPMSLCLGRQGFLLHAVTRLHRP
jgi:hypothetical protein